MMAMRAMAEFDEMAGRLVGAAPLVDAHRVDPGIRIADQQHDRVVGVAQRPDVIELAVAARIDQHAVDLAGAEHLEDPDFLVERRCWRWRTACRSRVRASASLDRLRGVGQGRIGDVGQHQADGLGLAADQRLGDLVGQVVELGRRLRISVARLLGNARAFAQGQRDRVDRKAGPVGDVLQPNDRPPMRHSRLAPELTRQGAGPGLSP